MKFNKKQPVRHEWQSVRINIHNSYIQIGCSGHSTNIQAAVEEAYPILQEFVNRLNILYEHLGCNPTLITPGGGSYYTILDLKGLSFEAAKFLSETLKNDNWDLLTTIDYRNGPLPPNLTFFENYLLVRICMERV